MCGHSATVTKCTIGTFLSIKQNCPSCYYCYSWESQPLLNDKVPAGNVLLSASILCSGSLPAKTIRMFTFMNCATISERTYYDLQKKYLHKSVREIWLEDQSDMISLLQAYNRPLSLAGDGRCDSSGFCAKFGACTFMELEHNAILHVELVQVSMFIGYLASCMYIYNRAMKLKVVTIWKWKG